MFTSQLVDMGQCKQMDIVRAFGVSPISVKRHVKKFRAEGPGSFFGGRKAKRPAVWTPEVLNWAQELFNQGKSRKEVFYPAQRLLRCRPHFPALGIHGPLADQK